MTADEAAGHPALNRCVACGFDVFATEHWARRPLLTRANALPSRFDDLLDTHAVDELVSRRGLRTPFLRMAKDGSVLATSAFTRGGGAGASVNDQAADDQVLAQLAGGATLVLQALHRTWPPVIDFATTLAAELGHPVQVNAYITPPQNQGFAPHYDVHDVFVLQVSGRKHWTIHEPVVDDPLGSQPWEQHRAAVAARAAGDAPLIDTVLEPGDALYLPRGTIHAAKALGETSIHLTVGVHPVTRYDIVRAVLDAAQRDTSLRTSLPVGVDLGDAGAIGHHVAATIDALHNYLGTVRTDDVAAALETHLTKQTRPEPVAPLAQLRTAEELTADTALRMRTALRTTTTHTDRGIEVRTLTGTLELDARCADALKTVMSGTAFAAQDLPGLDAAEQLDFARQLLRQGIVVPA